MALLVIALPADLERSRLDLETAIAARRDLQRRGAEAVETEPSYASAVEEKRAAVAAAETAWALAADAVAEKKLKTVRDQARGELVEAEDALKKVQILRSGVAQLVLDAEEEILIKHAYFDAALRPFCDDLLAQYRTLLRNSLFGAGMHLMRALRLGYALLELPFPGSLGSALEGVNIPDPGSAPGRPVPRFILADRAWPDDDLAGASLRDWQGDAEIVALHEMLKPLGAAHVATTVLLRQIKSRRAVAAEAERRAAAQAPKPKEPLPKPRTMTAAEQEEWLKSQPSDAEYRAEMRQAQVERLKAQFPNAGLRPQASYHGSRFADTKL